MIIGYPSSKTKHVFLSPLTCADRITPNTFETAAPVTPACQWFCVKFASTSTKQMLQWSRMRLEHRIVAGAGAAFLAVAIVFLPAASGQEFDISSYNRNVSIHNDTNIYWTIDTKSETIRVAVHAKIASGWASFGFSEMGGMEGSDIVYYEVAVRAMFQYSTVILCRLTDMRLV